MKFKNPTAKIIALFSTAIFVLTACSGGAVTGEAPEDVIKKFKETVKTVDSVDMTIALVMTGENDNDNIDFNLDADIKLDRQDQSDRKADIDLKVDGSLDAGGNDLNGNLALKILTMGEEFYFNVVKFDSNDPNTESYKTLLEPYENKWQHLASDFIPEDIKKLQNKDEETLQREEQLKDLFISTKLFEVVKEYGSEKINGVKVYHYGVKLNKNGVKEYVKKAASINGNEMTDAEVDEASLFADSVTNMELWIGEKDYYLYKGVVELSGESVEEDATSTISLTYTANSYNTDPKITAPAEFEEFNPLAILMGMQLSGMMGEDDGSLTEDDGTMMEDDGSATESDETMMEDDGSATESDETMMEDDTADDTVTETVE